MSPSGLPSSRLQAGSSLLAFAGKILLEKHRHAVCTLLQLFLEVLYAKKSIDKDKRRLIFALLSSLAFDTRVCFPTSGWLIEARNRFTSELGLEFHVYVFKTLIRLKNFSLFEFMIGVLCCNL